MSIIETILECQSDYYKRHNRAVSLLMLNKDTYRKLLMELEKSHISNLHGMQIILNSKKNLELI